MTDNTSEQNDGPDKSQPPWRSAVGALLWGPRSRPLWITAAVALALFAGFRAGLLIACREHFQDVGAADVWRCFLIGMKFDAMPIGFALLPMALALSLVSSATLASRRFRKLLAVYAATVLSFGLVIEISGAAFFLHEGARLNWLSFSYLTVEAIYFVWGSYPIWLMVPVTAAVYYISFRLLRMAQ